MSTLPPKPQSDVYRPELTRLPRLTIWRRTLRWILLLLIRLAVRILVRLEMNGKQNYRQTGPMLVVSNHLGDADLLVGMAVAPRPIDIVGKVELYDLPFWGRLMEAYGVIWVHRGQPDRRALRVILDGLAEGRMIAIAPEGRESVSGALEKGTDGAAYLALKAGVPILPVAFTGTENQNIYPNLKRWRRPRVTVTAGGVFALEKDSSLRTSIQKGTPKIMETLARLLPPEYQGVYRQTEELRGDHD